MDNLKHVELVYSNGSFFYMIDTFAFTCAINQAILAKSKCPDSTQLANIQGILCESYQPAKHCGVVYNSSCLT